MTKLEDCIEFIGTTAFRAALIIACSYIGASLAHAGEPKSPQAAISAELSGKPAPNLILTPEYTGETDAEDDDDEADALPPTEQKLQYEPIDGELPILLDRDTKNSKEKAGDGVEYEDNHTLMVSPAPDFVVKEEPIEDNEPTMSLAPEEPAKTN